MRTTIDLKKPTLDRAKARARESGRTLSDLVNDAVSAYLTLPQEKQHRPFKLITAGGPAGTAPSWEQIKQALDEEDIQHFKKSR